MASSIKITTTTSSSRSSSVLFLNIGYLKTIPGILKLSELILGIVCVGIIASYYSLYVPEEIFFYLMTVTFMIGTFCLFLSCFVSLATGDLISKSLFEIVYHSIATILLLASSVTLLIRTTERSNASTKYDPYMAASIIGLINTVLYLTSVVFAIRSYRRL